MAATQKTFCTMELNNHISLFIAQITTHDRKSKVNTAHMSHDKLNDKLINRVGGDGVGWVGQSIISDKTIPRDLDI